MIETRNVFYHHMQLFSQAADCLLSLPVLLKVLDGL